MATPVPPLPPDLLLTFLLQLTALLGTALLLGRLAVRCGLPPLVGELLTGLLLGPSVLGALPGRAEQAHLLDGIGQFGMLLLVGVVGAQLDPAVLRRHRSVAVRVSAAGLLLPLALGTGAGLLAPDRLVGADRGTFALFAGVAMAVSAVPVIAKTLADLGLLHRDVGQLALTAGVVDDAVGWLLLALVSALATGGLSAAVGARAVLGLAAAVAVAAAAAPLVRRVFGRLPDAGPATAVAVVLVLAGAAGTQALGREPVFGAFLAGLVVARSTDPDRLGALRTVVLAVLAPIFLATAGLRMDLGGLADPLVLGAAAVALAIATAGKFGGAYLGARSGGMSHWEGVALGAGMNARGVVEVVVALTGLRLGVLTADGFTIVVLIAIVTSVTAPPVLAAAMRRV